MLKTCINKISVVYLQNKINTNYNYEINKTNLSSLFPK